ncbi:homospermidine synthase [Pseudooceanicola batsensis HTCC2597]|uniref:Homospermidine synthase n=1 Tax=Pseudooceanicola batsensis (strain ATCC BAA-863 / DSM 15984 / KCTC 12145 / HTCC2597) TaxID=252305 RepID=A3TUX2_PSEBH|nr:saccharopine dehydrogenase NADP-binding domain-containing protein [Pseudooceanicola batsensis]EAQ04318.1 homospermidine synthase [Pseudooceanicola batsensis HTCC2597]
MTHPVYARIDGPIILIGYGSIGRGTLPLIERHFDFDRERLVIVEPNTALAGDIAKTGYRHVAEAVTEANYRELLGGLIAPGGFVVNLSVDTSSLDLIRFCREQGVLYIDTVVEPWAGYYFGTDDNAERTNYALRQAMRDEKAANPGGTTAVSCCGANPGMVSWFVKEALLMLARDTGVAADPETRGDWAQLMQTLGVKGVHIAERDTQVRLTPREPGHFVNTWSVEGFIAEGFQPAELGWGTAESWMPDNAHTHDAGCLAGIWLQQPGAATRVRTWCPTPGPQFGFLVTHNEAISIADYYTVGPAEAPEFRPTCHYAYHPCDDAVLSLHEMFGSNQIQDVHHILDVDEIEPGGIDELGVLLYGHEKNALWYGSRLSNEETKALAPDQNATGLQVTSAVLAGMVWALENPEAGIVETDEMDHRRCLEVQRPYLGPVEGHYTGWTPLTDRQTQFPEDLDEGNPWAFRNVLERLA